VSCFSGDSISVLSTATDPDEYDDLVLLHEYGHFWQKNYSKSDSLGGNHSFGSRVNPQLAWGEGTATFFGNLAKGTSLYLDTNASGIGLRVDIESLDASIPLGTSNQKQDGNLSEGIVAAVLWDLADATNEAKDTITNPTAVFNAAGHLKSASTDRGTPGVDLVDFLDAWFCKGHDTKGDAMSGVMGNVVGLEQFNYDFATVAPCP
jgi:hypothetical protein